VPLCQAGGKGERLPNVSLFQIGKISEQLLNRAPGSESFNDHAHGDAHPSNARLATHDLRIHRNAPQFLHAAMIT
jgi:hypothetical protein